MPLTSGTRLGPYEILEPIGAGGMGEVYRARDTKLGRDVAIKVLPEDFVRDPERLARFKREAQVLASLNHPNIAAIHGLEEHESQPFLVLELVEGEDLAERLMRGPIPVDEAIEIAKQVAEALEEAHEKGIIHRDLKPANVKQTPDGVVKVLDFGLAKAFSGEASQTVNMSDSPTMSRNATAAGVVLGTAAYMSPEQAKGKPVDRRADIWSFGALVYEMLTGTKAFARDDVSETLAAILRDEPDWNRLPSQTPPTLRRLLERCLRKNPRERQRDMGDARLELHAPKSEMVSVQAKSRSMLALVAGVILGALAIAGLWMSDTPPQPLVTKMIIPLPEGQTIVERLASPIAISPDGRTIVYAAEAEGELRLYRRPLDSNEATPIVGTEGGYGPFFSPDGRWLGFLTDRALKKVPAEGGASMTLATVDDSFGASWSPDGTIVYAPSAGADAVLMKVSQAGGESEPLYPDRITNPMSPQVLSDGETVLFRGVSARNLHAASLASGEVVQPEAPENFIAYVSSGHLLHWSDASVAAVPFDASRKEIHGESAVVLENVVSQTSAAATTNPFMAVSANGTMAYVSGARRAQRLVLATRDGGIKFLAPGPVHAPRLSPDARRVAYTGEGTWLYDFERESRTRMGSGGVPAWGPDGRRMVLGTTGSPQSRVVAEMLADGSAEAKTLLEGSFFVDDWSSDGRFVALTESSPETGIDILILEYGNAEPTPHIVTPHDENATRFSPDGRHIAYISDDSGQREVYVRSFPEAEGRVQISTRGGTAPIWSDDGAELFYREGRDVMVVDINTDGELQAGSPRLVLSGKFHADATGHAGYDVMPDGQSFVMIQEDEEAPLTEIHVVLNWFEELNRLVPTK